MIIIIVVVVVVVTWFVVQEFRIHFENDASSQASATK
jgi:hypothetical protein